MPPMDDIKVMGGGRPLVKHWRRRQRRHLRMTFKVMGSLFGESLPPEAPPLSMDDFQGNGRIVSDGKLLPEAAPPPIDDSVPPR